ncbi:hypothetical protein [Actinocorallia aurea]
MTAALLVPPAPADLRALTARIAVTGGRPTDRAAFARAAGTRLGPGLALDVRAATRAVPGPASPVLAGALGAVVLVDARRPGVARAALDACEDAGAAVVAAVVAGLPGAALRTALDLDEAVPLLSCDPADPGSARSVLLALLGANVVAVV